MRFRSGGESLFKGWPFGKTGPIHCPNGFKAEVRLIKPCGVDNDWYGTILALMAHQIPVDQCRKKFYSLRNKDDPEALVYGLYPQDQYRFNLKGDSNGSHIPRDEPIIINYSKKDQTVSFTSKTFDFSQTGLP